MIATGDWYLINLSEKCSSTYRVKKHSPSLGLKYIFGLYIRRRCRIDHKRDLTILNNYISHTHKICPHLTLYIVSFTSCVPPCRCLLSLDVRLRSPHLPLRNSEAAGVQVRTQRIHSLTYEFIIVSQVTAQRFCCGFQLMLHAAALYLTNNLYS